MGVLSSNVEQQTHGWSVVVALAMVSSFNAFMCMSYSATESASAKATGIEEHEVPAFYSAYFLSLVIWLGPITWFGERYERAALNLSAIVTAIAAWCRWLALYTGRFQYEACMISQVLIGLGACPISTLPGQISNQRFTPERRALTTSMMLMANYTGWLFGSCVPAWTVAEGSVQSLTSFFFTQCIYSVFVAAIYFLLYRPLPNEVAWALELASGPARKSELAGFLRVFKAICEKPQFALQLATHALHGAVGFVIPSAIFFIQKDLNLPPMLNGVTNVAFIGSGVLGGIVLGAYGTEASLFPRLLKICYVLGPVSTVGVCFVSYHGMLHGLALDISVVSLMVIGGFSTLGFTGVAFEDLARFPGISTDYALWIGYEVLLVVATLLNLVVSNSMGFFMLASLSLLTSSLFLACYVQAQPCDDSLSGWESKLPSSLEHAEEGCNKARAKSGSGCDLVADDTDSKLMPKWGAGCDSMIENTCTVPFLYGA